MEKCRHIDPMNTKQKTHVLPCRHELCMSCVYRIKELFEGSVFSCPLCGNFSQYVDTMIESIRADNYGVHTDPSNRAICNTTFAKYDETSQDKSSGRYKKITGNPESRKESFNEGESPMNGCKTDNLNQPPRQHGATERLPHSSAQNNGSPHYDYLYNRNTPNSSKGGGFQTQANSYQHEEPHAGSSTFDNTNVSSLQNANNVSKGDDLICPDQDQSYLGEMDEDEIKQQMKLLQGFEQDKHDQDNSNKASLTSQSTPHEDREMKNTPISSNYSKSKKSVETDARFCKDHFNSEIYFFCKTCDVPVCAKCTTTIHKDHICHRLDAGEDNVADELVCEQHKRRVNMFCKQCNTLLCRNCVDGFHKYHGAVAIQVARINITSTIEKYMEYIRRGMGKYETQYSSIEKQQNDIIRKSNELKQNVEAETDRAHKEIDSIRAEQMTKIEKKVHTCLASAHRCSEELAEIGKLLHDAKAIIISAQQRLENNDLPTACVAAESLKENIDVLSSMKVSLPSEHFNLELYKHSISRHKDTAPVYVHDPHYGYLRYGSYMHAWSLAR